MNTRYHIEELVSQDAKGVVFQGVDSVTGVVVAMRRFISAGSGNDRLKKEEGAAFGDAVAKLKKVSHPSLRRVLAGGCDPVDGMPYLVTRWVDGVPLGDVISIEGALDPELALRILGQLLNANVLVAKTLGCDGLWLEVSLGSVVVKPPRDEGEAPAALFWLCPWRWIEADANGDEMMALADFAEAMLGGPREIAAGQVGGDLPKWIQRIRNKEISSLREAQESLNVPGNLETPFVLTDEALQTSEDDGAEGKAAISNVSERSRPTGTAADVPSGGHGVRPSMVAAVIVLLGLIGFFSWRISSHSQGEPAQAAEVNTPPATPAPSKNQSRIDEMMSEIHRDTPAAEERVRHVERRGYYTIHEADLLLAREGQEVTLRGRLTRVRFSSSGLTMYLEFSDVAPLDEPRAYAMTRDLTDGIRAEDFEALVGRQIEIRGAVDIENISRTHRPRISLHRRDQIHVLEGTADYELR